MSRNNNVVLRKYVVIPANPKDNDTNVDTFLALLANGFVIQSVQTCSQSVHYLLVKNDQMYRSGGY